MAKKWVYLFNEVEQAEKYVKGDWDKVRGLMGGKGANLAEMTRITLYLCRLLSRSQQKPVMLTRQKENSRLVCGIR